MSSPEEEPSLTVHLEDASMEARRENATLFTFLGERAIFDHVYFQFDDGTELDAAKGYYLFKDVSPEPYASISEYLLRNNYPAVLNMPEVEDADRSAYLERALVDLNESTSVPEAWLTA